jgi:hypothetical protein
MAFMAFSVFTCDEIEWLSVKRAGGKIYGHKKRECDITHLYIKKVLSKFFNDNEFARFMNKIVA